MPIDSSLAGFSFKVANFKCFGPEPQGFEELKLVNVIIGRNNSGKSALLDLIRDCTDGKFKTPPRHLWHGVEQPTFVFGATVSEQVARRVFPEGTRGGELSRWGNHWQFGRQVVGAHVTWRMLAEDRVEFIAMTPPDGREPEWPSQESRIKYGAALGRACGNPLNGKIFRRLYAERDIRPENDDKSLVVTEKGDGATNIIQNYIIQVDRDHDLVERTLLAALNTVFAPDAVFTNIRCQQQGNAGAFEIHLEEEHKGRIALSHSGSGLKTVMLVLINLLLIPAATSTSLANYVFGFEELENNLHPALLRRLLVYIANRARETGFQAFVTTHSSAAIDMFAKDSDAQIIHVRHDGKTATATQARTYIQNSGVLDDLDIRASDLLQANSIIWVEGRSDRIYINRWIALWSDGQLKEGFHYQCVFYGGRLLSHLEACSPDDAQSGIAILRLARHACVVIDSDKRAPQTRINDTKKRIEVEVQSVGGLAWITKGREVENYIPNAAFQSWKGWTGLGERDPYDDVFALIDANEGELGKYYRERKPLLAEAIVPLLTKANCEKQLDLGERLDQLTGRIREWNRLPE